MNVLCAICQDSLEPSNDIFITPCGHVFHFPCLIQWLEKSQSCPQCRQKTRRDKLTRIYFNFSNTEVIKEDSFSLQQKVDSLSFQIKLKEKEFTTCREDNITLKKHNSGLREEVKKTESIVNEKNAVIRALKEQSQYYKHQCEDYDKIKKEKQALQIRLDRYDDVKMMLSCSNEEVDQIVKQTADIKTLATYVGIMKRELNVSINKKRELRNHVKRLQQDLQTMQAERNSFADDYVKQIERLEEELAICRSERDDYQNRLTESRSRDQRNDDRAEAAQLPSVNTPSRKRETDIEFEFDEIRPKKIKRATEKPKSVPTKDKDDSDIVLVSPNVKKTKENEENSPYLPTKSKSIMALKERPSQRGTFTIGSKRPLLSAKTSGSFKSSRERDNAITFDGFGGHSKVETFPLPKNSPNKLKRSASDTSKTKKLKLDLGGNKQLDDYIINLT